RRHVHGHGQARSARAAVRLRQLAMVTATPAMHGTNHAQPTAGARPTWPEVSGVLSRATARTRATASNAVAENGAHRRGRRNDHRVQTQPSAPRPAIRASTDCQVRTASWTWVAV